MKLFVIIFLAILAAGSSLAAYQKHESKKQSIHDQSVKISISILKNTTASLTYTPKDLEKRKRVEAAIIEAKKLKSDSRTSASDSAVLFSSISTAESILEEIDSRRMN